MLYFTRVGMFDDVIERLLDDAEHRNPGRLVHESLIASNIDPDLQGVSSCRRPAYQRSAAAAQVIKVRGPEVGNDALQLRSESAVSPAIGAGYRGPICSPGQAVQEPAQPKPMAVRAWPSHRAGRVRYAVARTPGRHHPPEKLRLQRGVFTSPRQPRLLQISDLVLSLHLNAAGTGSHIWRRRSQLQPAELDRKAKKLEEQVFVQKCGREK